MKAIPLRFVNEVSGEKMNVSTNSEITFFDEIKKIAGAKRLLRLEKGFHKGKVPADVFQSAEQKYLRRIAGPRAADEAMVGTIKILEGLEKKKKPSTTALAIRPPEGDLGSVLDAVKSDAAGAKNVIGGLTSGALAGGSYLSRIGHKFDEGMLPTDIAKSAIKAPRRKRTFVEEMAHKTRKGYTAGNAKKNRELMLRSPAGQYFLEQETKGSTGILAEALKREKKTSRKQKAKGFISGLMKRRSG